RLSFGGSRRQRRRAVPTITLGVVALAFVANRDRRNFTFRTTRRLRAAARLNLAASKPLASPDYAKLADSTRKNWSPWLDRISEHFGDLRIAKFDRPEKIRPVIRRWRNQWADKPRTADFGMQVLSRVLSYAVDPLSKVAGNPCEGIKRLYRGDRSEIIWTDSD